MEIMTSRSPKSKTKGVFISQDTKHVAEGFFRQLGHVISLTRAWGERECLCFDILFGRLLLNY